MFVVSMETCPSHARIVLISTPARSRWVAVVWRIVCGLTRLLASQIHGVSATDPWTFAAVVTIVALVGLTACLLPARRAARVDPLVSLRYE